MFIIKNITTHDIEIPELRVTLAPNEKLDLDMVSSRFYIDQSRTLKFLFNSKKLECILKDDGTKTLKVAEKKEDVANVHKNNPVDVIDAVKQLEDKLTKRLDEKAAKQQPQVDMNALNQTLAALQTLVGNSQNMNQNASPKVDKIIVDVDDTKAVDIQKRTLNRLVNKAQSNVKHDEQITSSDVNKNVNELEGLL
jgi:hypothetical protein